MRWRALGDPCACSGERVLLGSALLLHPARPEAPVSPGHRTALWLPPGLGTALPENQPEKAAPWPGRGRQRG